MLVVPLHYGDPFGPLAMILCELGQVRKEATAADDSCAEVWLLGLPPNLLKSINYSKLLHGVLQMTSENPILYNRNSIYYY